MATKKHTLTLDLDDEPSPFEEWAFLLFHTTTPGYLFADSLNRLYDYRLERVDDIPYDGSFWPLYLHLAPVRRLRYFLVECPAASAQTLWEASDKLLIVKGSTADDEVQRINDDFAANPQAPAVDLRAQQHRDIILELLEGFTVASILDLSNAPAPSRSRANAVTHSRTNAITHFIDHIESHQLDLTLEEKRRIENNLIVQKLK
jgi:hypothetical protein